MSLTGFSLVEVLISLLILGIGIVITFNLLPLAWQSLSYSRKLNEVAYLAQEKLEELRAKGDSIEAGDSSGSKGDLTWNISIKPLELQENIKVIYVELYINFAFQGVPQTQKFATYIYKSDIQ